MAYPLGKNLWQIEVGRGTLPKPYYRRFKGTKKEAEAFAAKIKSEIMDGTFITNNSLTFKDLSDKWIKVYAKPTLAPKTLAEYERLLGIINSEIGHFKVMNIKPLILVEFYNGLRNRPGKIKLSERSILKYYALINAILNKGVQWDLIKLNPNSKVDRPKTIKKEAKFYNIEQTKSLITALEGENPRDRSLIMLAIDTGARRGELTGLEWEDIDFENNIVNINKVTQAARGLGIIEKLPKNNSSIRKVYMTDPTANYLKEWQREQAILKKQHGSKWKNSKKIFTTWDGDWIHPDRPSHIFKEIQKKNNLDELNFHGLRHTSVSLLIAAGVQTQVISKRVGHSSSATTQNIYSHVFESSEKEVVNKLNSILN